MPTGVVKFMTDKARATERERILHLTAARDLKLYAASHDARLLITDPELDLDGYDFAMSSGFESVYVQSKATLKKGGARSWDVRAALLKPSFYNRDLIPALDGYTAWGMEVGGDGGVLLHVVDQEASDLQDLRIEYRYLDVFWLIGVAIGATMRPAQSRNRALALLRQIRDAETDDKIRLNFGDFAQLPSVEALAALRLHIGVNSNWAGIGRWKKELTDPSPLSEHLRLVWPGIEAVR